ncbi:hypothetical protein K227x_44750 [Rubripirellula lacrimiformis]|uniref:Lipid/polyisoprenoid-binding YceI-like domain-containing protein n=1 Tax=Rubripirellula lacrimiformis TaxID=1930273 RepID=A0A517NG58_9BACT|nr:YceI family protein [Rubripirellula lacrimiformis]QDT06068.1 hypothetical protein K227x_44750 [Rubripirellula lacrimiformis]
MKMRILGSLMCALALVGMFQPVAAAELELVPGKSKIHFVGSKSDGQHKGGFKKFTVDSLADFENPQNSSITIVIEAASLWSDDDKLTNHLKNADFFDVRKYPKITFASSEIVSEKPVDKVAKAKIKGEMEMLGKKVAIEVPVDVTITEDFVELDGSFEIDRTKWGMTYGQGKVNNEVKIEVELVFKR